MIRFWKYLGDKIFDDTYLRNPAIVNFITNIKCKRKKDEEKIVDESACCRYSERLFSCYFLSFSEFRSFTRTRYATYHSTNCVYKRSTLFYTFFVRIAKRTFSIVNNSSAVFFLLFKLLVFAFAHTFLFAFGSEERK